MVKHVSSIASVFSKLLGFVLISAACASFIGNVFFSDAGSRSALIDGELRNLRVINENIEQRNYLMAERVHAMRTDDRVLEELAREELGMIRSGETIFLFPPEFDNQFADASLSH